MKQEHGYQDPVAPSLGLDFPPTGRKNVSVKGDTLPDPQHLIHKLRALHSEAQAVYGLDLFTAFLGDGGTKIETVVHSRDATIAKVMMDGPAKECHLAALKSLQQAAPPPPPSPPPAESQTFHLVKEDEGSPHDGEWFEDNPSDVEDADARQTHLYEDSTAQADADSASVAEEAWCLIEGGGDRGQGMDDGEDDDNLQPAPPGLGAAGLWAREAASLKRKMGARGASGLASDLHCNPMKRICPSNPMPTTNKELALLIRDVVGARPKYGDESARPAYWPDDVPWQKGKSISQMNNLTLRRLARAVLQHQTRTRELARASGSVVPEGVLGCAQRTKKELSALIRSKLGLRLQYGEHKKRPQFWPENVPWVKGKPLSMMNHAQLSSVFAAMVGAGLCPAGACLEPINMDADNASNSGSSESAAEKEEDDNDDTTSEDRSEADSGGIDDDERQRQTEVGAPTSACFSLDGQAAYTVSSLQGSLTQHPVVGYEYVYEQEGAPSDVGVNAHDAVNEVIDGGGGEGGEIRGRVDASMTRNTLLPSFPSLGCLDGLPLNVSTDEGLAAFGASSAHSLGASLNSHHTHDHGRGGEEEEQGKVGEEPVNTVLDGHGYMGFCADDDDAPDAGCAALDSWMVGEDM